MASGRGHCYFLLLGKALSYETFYPLIYDHKYEIASLIKFNMKE
jgi:hypothetical protein